MFTHTNESRESWIKEVSLESSLVEGVKNSDILFLPIKKYKDINYIFFTTAEDFFKYVKKQNKASVDICINNDDYNRVSLNSREFRLGTILVKEFVLPVLVGLVINYFSDNLKTSVDDEVSISIIVEKENGNYQLDYKGNIDNFIKLKDQFNLKKEDVKNDGDHKATNQI